MRKKVCTCLFVMVLAGAVSAEPLLYDPFDYPVGEPPSRLSDADGAEAGGWLYINNNNTDDPRMAAGSLSYPGLLPSSGNSVAIDGSNAATAASQSQRAIPGQPFGEGTKLYYSVIMKVNSLEGMFLTGANYAGGSFIAGFRDADATTLFGASNAGAPVLIRAANTAGTAYQLGTSVTATATERAWFGDNGDALDDPVTDFDTSDTLLLVLSYDNVLGNGNDVVRMYINPDPALSEEANAMRLALERIGGTEIAGNDIQSFFFRNNSVSPDVVQFDELRIAATWEDVLPVPEPAVLAPLALAALALTARRRRP
jgi:hypothetical protein